MRLEFDQSALREFCRRWRITELSLFGSALRDDFGPGSDVDVLAVFEDDAPWSGWDLMRAQRELAEIFGKPVDLLERRAVESHHNPYLKAEILRTARRVFAA